MATKTHGSLAADAASYLTRGGNVIPVSRGGSSEIHSQSQQLLEWAIKKGCVITRYNLPPEPLRTNGAEHDVYFHDGQKRVFKRTRPGSFGSIKTEVGIRKTATPYFYLCRIELTNEVFGSDLMFEGVINEDGISALISQPWIHPVDPKNPLPSDQEVAKFMRSMDFRAVPGSYHEWFRKADCIHVCDARPDNFIKSREGAVPASHKPAGFLIRPF